MATLIARMRSAFAITGLLVLGLFCLAIVSYRLIFPWWLTYQWENTWSAWLQSEYGVTVEWDKPRIRPLWFSAQARQVTLWYGKERLQLQRPRIAFSWDLYRFFWKAKLESYAVWHPLGTEGEAASMHWNFPIKLETTGSFFNPSTTVEATLHGRMLWEWKEWKQWLNSASHQSLLSPTVFSTLKKTAFLGDSQSEKWSAHADSEFWLTFKPGGVDTVTILHRQMKLQWEEKGKRRIDVLSGKGQWSWAAADPHTVQIAGFVPDFRLQWTDIYPNWRSALDYSARLQWQPDGAFELVANKLHWVRAEEEGFLQARWDSATQDLHALVLLPRIKAKAFPTQLPVRFVGHTFHQWLSKGLLSGQAESVVGVVRGFANAFPFSASEKGENGRFWVTGRVRDVALHYADGWPDLHAMNGSMRWDSNALSGVFSSGTVQGQSIDAAHFEITQIGDLHQVPLNVVFRLSGSPVQLLETLQHTPLMPTGFSAPQEPKPSKDGKLGGGRHDLQLSGQTQTDVVLRANALTWDPMQINGTVKLVDVAAHYGFVNLTGLNGTLGFTHDTLDPHSGFTAQWGEHLWKIGVTGTPQAWTVHASGDWPLPREWTGTPLAGTAPAVISLEVGLASSAASVAKKVQETRWWLKSALKNVPLPFAEWLPLLGQKKSENGPLCLEGIWGSPVFHGRYGRQLSWVGEWGAPSEQAEASHALSALGLKRLGIHLGSGKPVLPQDAGWGITGQLDHWDAAFWNQSKGETDWLAWRPQQAQLLALPLVALDLRLPRMEWRGGTVGPVHLGLRHNRLVFEQPHLAGLLDFPESPEKPWRLVINRWNIPLSVLNQAHASQLTGKNLLSEFLPQHIPPMHIDVQQIQYGSRWQGRFSCTVKPDAAHRSVQLEGLRFQGPHIDFTGRAVWGMVRDQQQTHLSGEMKTDSLGALLRAWEWNSSLAEAPGLLALESAWPGNPLAFNWQFISGKTGVDLKAGRLLDIEPGVGRVVGLLNLEGLTRRLRLDFSDLYKKGMSFDKITGTLHWDKGELKTRDLHIRGTTASIRIMGQAGLVRRDYNWEALVEPQVSAGLPLAAAVAVGSPAIGAAFLVADRLLNRQVNVITARKYTITGSWDNPVIHMQKQELPRKNP